MTAVLSKMITVPSADTELMVRRLFKVAEILSRRQAAAESVELFIENSPEKHDYGKIGYLETKDHLKNA